MSAAISPTSAKTYGVERVCAVWEQPRSSFYAWRLNNKGIGAPGPAAHKRGSQTGLSDLELCGKIQADLARSPFQGEGYRKVWARLRVQDEIRVSRKRVLRIMRRDLGMVRRQARRRSGQRDGIRKLVARPGG